MPETNLKPQGEPERAEKAQAKPKERLNEAQALAQQTRSKAKEIDLKTLKEAEKRGLEAEQWEDLFHLMNVMLEPTVKLEPQNPPDPNFWIQEGITFEGGEIHKKDSLKLNLRPNLERLPDNLKIDSGIVWLMGCLNLSHLPKKFKATGQVWLTGSGIVDIPEGFELVKGPLTANACPNLATVSKTHFPSSVSLADCPLLTSLPEGFQSDEGLVRLDRSPIKVLPRMDVKSLSAVGCPLEALSDKLRVHGELTLSANAKSAVKQRAEQLKKDGKIASVRYV